jgi:hypothetical protein
MDVRKDAAAILAAHKRPSELFDALQAYGAEHGKDALVALQDEAIKILDAL